MEEREHELDPKDLGDPHQDQEFDRNLVECNLSLTPAQRLEGHEAFREFMEIARQARIKLYGFDPAAAPFPE